MFSLDYSDTTSDRTQCGIYVQVGLPEVPDDWHRGTAAAAAADPTAAQPPAAPAAAAAVSTSAPEVLGWEANNEGKLRAR